MTLSLERARVLDVDDAGGHQLLTLEVGSRQRFTSVMRSQPHGISSVPSVGAQGLVLFRDGRRELAVGLGFEHVDQRPVSQGAGATVLYDAQGGVMSIVNRTCRLVVDEFTVVATTVIFDATCKLGGAAASKRVALDGDPVDGTVVASATRVYGM